MNYSEYSKDIHVEMGNKICTDTKIYGNNSKYGYSYISNEDLLKFLENKNKKITLDLINDMLSIWSPDKKIKFMYYGCDIFDKKLNKKVQLIFPSDDWLKFKPIMFNLLNM